MPGPMEGIRVVELGVWIAAPAAGVILADWGADVTKIEPPGVGDPGRLFRKMLGGDLPVNPPFENDNRGKRSIVLDLSTDEGKGVALEMIDRADVLITNVRVAGLARLGLDPASVLERYPRLIYGLITGHGLEGPDAHRPAYDIGAYWARSGVAASLTQPGSTPPFQRGGMGDHGAGLALAGAISAALYSREKTGKGQLVSTSLMRQGMYTLSFDLAIMLRLGIPVMLGERTAMFNPMINNYQDSEGKWFWLIGLEGDRHWPSLARAVGHPEWIDDERFSELTVRASNCTELIGMLDEIFATKTLAEWGVIFDAEKDLWWAPVQTIEEVLADPQAHAAGGFVEVPDGEATTMMPATPVDFAGTPGEQRWMAPEQGQHSDEVLTELGKSGEEITALRKSGALG